MRSHERNRRAFTRPSKHEAAARAGLQGGLALGQLEIASGARKDLPWDWAGLCGWRMGEGEGGKGRFQMV